jgi:predicted dehydrogenase
MTAIGRLRELVGGGAIGDPRLLAADFGFRHSGGPTHRLFDPALGGGALLDVGAYMVSLASMLFGPAEQVAGLAHRGPTGVDEQSAFVLRHAEGRLAQAMAAIRVATPQEATVIGTDGSIRVHPLWWKATRLTVTDADGRSETIDEPFSGNGYQLEAVEVMRCLRQGRRESDVMPLDETVGVIRTMDELRAQWGLRYPGE